MGRGAARYAVVVAAPVALLLASCAREPAEEPPLQPPPDGEVEVVEPPPEGAIPGDALFQGLATEAGWLHARNFLLNLSRRTNRSGQLLLFSHGRVLNRILSRNFKKLIMVGVRASWIEYLTLSTLESLTTLAAINNSFKRAIRMVLFTIPCRPAAPPACSR